MTIRRGGPADLPALEALWVSVHHRHAASMPALGPYVSDAETWRVRGSLYAGLLATPGTILLLATDGDGGGAPPLGYGLARVVDAADTWVADTWVTGRRIGEIESLAVVAERRGEGIGTALLDGLEQELHDAGVHDLVVGALPGNAAALRLYERRGYRPTWLYLSRFAR